MRSICGSRAASVLAGILAAGIGASASVALAQPAPPAASDQAKDKSKDSGKDDREKAKSELAARTGKSMGAQVDGTESDRIARPGDDKFRYELRAPVAFRTYEAVTDTCAAAGPGAGTGSGASTDPGATGTVIVAGEGSEFAALRTSKQAPTQLVIKFTTFTRPAGQQTGAATGNNAVDHDGYFCIALDELASLENSSSILKRYSRRDSIGAVYGLSLVLPFKLRPATAGFNTALTESLTVGGVLGVRWRISKYLDYHVDFPIATLGLSTLDIEQGRAPSAMDGGKQVLGFTASVGGVLELSDFQIGLMAGIDRAPGDQGRDWVYNGKIWYSFSIGYTFLKNPAN